MKQKELGTNIKRLFMIVVMAFLLAGAAMPMMASNASAATPAFSIPKSISIHVGEKKTVSASVTPSGANVLTNISYGYDNRIEASGTDAGSYWGGKTGGEVTITGKTAGSSYLKMTINIFDPNTKVKTGTVTLQSEITVLPAGSTGNNSGSSSPAANIPLKSISLNSSSLSMNEGDSRKLTVSYDPVNTTDSKSVTWTSSDTAVASVINGTVSAKKPGSASITAKVGARTAVCRITVKAKPVSQPQSVPLERISLSRLVDTVNVNTVLTVPTVYYYPSNATVSKTVNWTNSNPAVAVMVSGRIVARGAGAAVFTAQMGTKTARYILYVREPGIPLKSISLNKSSDVLTAGDTMYLSVTYNPSNTTVDKSVIWSSSDPSVASVVNRKVVAKRAGTAVITAKVGNKTATCKVTVKAKEKNGIVSKKGTEVLNALNKYRASKGRPKLKYNAKLQKTAELRAKELEKRYSHTRPNGKSCFTAFPSGLKVKGENIAMGQTSSSEVMSDWKNSTGHRSNMLDTDFTKVGCACFYADGTYYWVQAFGR